MIPAKDARTRAGSKGFSLLELSIVLVIVAVVSGMAIQSGVSVLATSRLSATQHKMKAIEDALMAFRNANDRLPCPADLTITKGTANYGVEAAVPGTCTGSTPTANFSAKGITNTIATGVEGGVPFATLGLSNDFMYDGWGNRFRYAVDSKMTATGAFATIKAGCVNGPITIKDASGNARSTGSLYALVSHGANGHGAFTSSGVTMNAGSVNTNELANCHCKNDGTADTYAPTYVQMDATRNPANALDNFDDIVVAKERWQMRTDFDTMGGCPPSFYIYVLDKNNGRVQKFDGKGNYIKQFGVGSYWVTSLAVDSVGNVWVTEGSGYRVYKYDNDGNYLASVGDYPMLGLIYGIYIDAQDHLWVADGARMTVFEFDTSNGNLIQSIFVGAGVFRMSVLAGKLWVTSMDWARVVVYDVNTGNELFYTASLGYRNFGIAPSSDGTFLWVMNAWNQKITKLSSVDGSILDQWGTVGTGDGEFGNSGGFSYFYGGNYDIARDPNGNFWITDTSNNRIEEFDSNGNYLRQFGSSGSGDGQFDWPWGIAISTK